MASSSTGSIKLGSSSPRPDTLTRFDTGHMRKRSFGAGRDAASNRKIFCVFVDSRHLTRESDAYATEFNQIFESFGD
jgi:hypothetical protein